MTVPCVLGWTFSVLSYHFGLAGLPASVLGPVTLLYHQLIQKRITMPKTMILLALGLLLPSLVCAAPMPFLGLGDSDKNETSTSATTAVSNDTINSNLVRPAEFSRIAYCTSGAVMSWKCGPPCDATPGVKVLSAGGGRSISFKLSSSMFMC